MVAKRDILQSQVIKIMMTIEIMNRNRIITSIKDLDCNEIIS